MPDLRKITELMDELHAYQAQNIVIKIGGNSIAEDAGFLTRLARQLEFLQSRHVRITLVHGGGPQIDKALIKAGITPVKGADGRRLTDPATMDVVAATMAQISREVALALAQQGCTIFTAADEGECFVTAQPLQSEKFGQSEKSGEARPAAPTQDRTGMPAAVDNAAITQWLRQNRIVILNSVGIGQDGLAYNINADDYAMAVAIALGARRLILATNVNGVYDKNKRPISALSPALAAELIANGVISGGMIPKVESALAALKAGVGGVAIIDAHQNWAILGELLTKQGFGTLISN